MKQIYFVNAQSGSAGIVSTTKETIGEFLSDELGSKFQPEKYLIRHNGKCPDSPQVTLSENDTISVTLTKIEGHPNWREVETEDYTVEDYEYYDDSD